ncbi:MAG: hypothetical protein V7641_842 [Blastocatellia bacterium]
MNERTENTETTNVIYLPTATGARHAGGSARRKAAKESVTEDDFTAAAIAVSDYVKTHARAIWLLASERVSNYSHDRDRREAHDGIVVVDMDMKLAGLEEYKRRWFLSREGYALHEERLQFGWNSHSKDDGFYRLHGHRIQPGGEWANLGRDRLPYENLGGVDIVCLRTLQDGVRYVWYVDALYRKTKWGPGGSLKRVWSGARPCGTL